MKSRFNNYVTSIMTFCICSFLLTGCAHLETAETSTSSHLGDLMPGQPQILETGTPEEIRQVAIADARADIAAGKPRIAITGGIAAWPTGVSEKYFKLVLSYPRVDLPSGCTSPCLGQAATYAEAYNKEILPYILGHQ
jgi:hypothetical protein